jgi:hypothetical protein
VSTSSTTAAVADPSAALALVLAVASGFFAVGVYYFLRITAAAERLAVRRLRARLAQSGRLVAVGRLGPILAVVDGVSAIGLRLSIALPLALLWFLLVPVFLTVGSIALAASIVRF